MDIIMKLHQVSPGSTARLLDFSDASKKHQTRYLSLGLMPGAEIRVLRKAPLGCPVEIKVGSTLLSMRKTELAELLVEVVQ